MESRLRQWMGKSLLYEKLDDVLNKIIVPYGFSYVIDDKTVVIKKANDLPADQPARQTKAVSGVVNDQNGMSLPGVSVVAKGTTIGTVTDV